MKRTRRIVLGIICSAGLTGAQAQLINVQFADNATGDAYGGGGPTIEPTQSGAAVLGSAGDLWNALSGFTYSSYPTGGSGGPYSLICADGSPSSVTVRSLTFNGSNASNEPNFPSTSAFNGTPWANLMGAYISVPSQTPPGYVSLTGLAPSATYDLVCYSAPNESEVRSALFTVNGILWSTAYNGTANTLAQGVDYVEFTGVKSDGAGNLVITFSGTGSAQSGLNAEGDFNGFQLEQVPNISLSISALGSGNLQVVASGIPNELSHQTVYVLQSTTDFVAWTGVVTNRGLIPPWITNTVSSTNVVAFYRASITYQTNQ
jgi:hypothetical protein